MKMYQPAADQGRSRDSYLNAHYSPNRHVHQQQLGSLEQNQEQLVHSCASWEEMSYQLMGKTDQNRMSPPKANTTPHSNGLGHHHVTRQPSVAFGLFDGLREAQETSTNVSDLMAKTFHAVALGFPCTVVLGGLTILPISMIAIGGGNYYKCPASDWLPIWLIITGILLMFYCILLLRLVGKLRQEESGELLEDFDAVGYNSSKHFVWVLTALQLFWFFIGNYSVLSIYYPHTEIPDDPPFVYCSEALYNFCLFWLGLVYAAIIFIVICSILSVQLYRKNSTRYMSFQRNSYNRI